MVVKGYSISSGSRLANGFNMHGVPAILFVGSNRIGSGAMNTIAGTRLRRGVGTLLWWGRCSPLWCVQL